MANDAAQLKAWERLASAGIGIGVSAGALWWLARNPRSEAELDLGRRSLRVVRLGLTGRWVRQLPFDQLAGVELERGADSDGDPVWRPAVRLTSGGLLPISQLWSHDEAEVRRAAGTVADACRLSLEQGPRS